MIVLFIISIYLCYYYEGVIVVSFTWSKQMLTGGLERIQLFGPDMSVAILPQMGFNLHSWIINGRDYLMPTQDLGRHGIVYGIPILFPFPGKTSGASYFLNNKEYLLKKTGAKREMHGLVYDESFTWHCDSEDSFAWCEGSLTIDKNSPLYESYPFDCTLKVRYLLDSSGLKMNYKVINQSDTFMPFGFGLHPFFNHFSQSGDVMVRIPCSHIHELIDKASTGKLLPVPISKDLRSFTPIEQLDMDDAYANMDATKQVQIKYPQNDITIQLEASDEFTTLVACIKPGLAGFMVENWSSAPDAMALYAKNMVDSSGILLLDVQQVHEGFIHMLVV